MRVVIVGGGIVGLCSAYFLDALGASPIVLEKGRVGSGASWANAGWISPTETSPLAEPGMVALAARSTLSRRGPVYVDAFRLLSRSDWFICFALSCNWHAYSRGTL